MKDKINWISVTEYFKTGRGNAFIDSANDLVSDAALVPLVLFLSRTGGTFDDDGQKRRFLPLDVCGPDAGPLQRKSETKLQEDLKAIEAPHRRPRSWPSFSLHAGGSP